MASTYTDNAGIEQPGPGEQSGTWGTTTNRNFDIIDRCLNGVGEITLNGTSSVLNTADGAESDGHYRVLYLAGTPTGTHTVTISPNDQDKLYFVHNANGLGHSVVFTQGSGGNVTIADGRSKIIYADGKGTTAKVTDFSSLIDASSNATSGVPSGTKQLFVQTSAPTGWTKETSSHDESAIRVTTGNASSGGSVDFTTLFTGTVGGTVATSVSGTVAGRQLTVGQIPNHQHYAFHASNVSGGTQSSLSANTYAARGSGFAGGSFDEKYAIGATGSAANVGLTSGAIGASGSSHDHGWSGTATSTFSNGNDLAVKYVDVIIATKD